jgi:hypothetical protein
MIVLIGGPPRVGKTQLAQLVCARDAIPFASTDAVRQVVNVADPAFGEMPWRDLDAARAHADRFFPFLDAFVSEYDFPDRRFVIEGVEFLPQQAAELGAARSARSCFLGLSECSVDALELEPAPGNWIWDAAPTDRPGIAADIVGLSRWLKAECGRLDLLFLDMVGDRTVALERAYAILMGASNGASGARAG